MHPDEINGFIISQSDGARVVMAARPTYQRSSRPENGSKLKSIVSDESWPALLADCEKFTAHYRWQTSSGTGGRKAAVTHLSTTIGVSDADEQHRWHRLIDEAQVAKKGVAVWQHRTCRSQAGRATFLLMPLLRYRRTREFS